ncbi:hypothetical protein RND81_09G022900 [Saponaria officinalis]|uniref:Pentatricopeptide repeat-containing protein n=1 Tax=Saponaria officinalis TaxID=3572 RepID=A0AAW1IH21_SAPOF
MGTPNFSSLKQLISKSTFQFLKQLSLQQPRNPQFNSPSNFTITRNLTQIYPNFDNSLHTKTVQFVANLPKTSIIPLLEQYEKCNVVKHNELKKIIHTLRQKHLFDRALEVSEWMTSRSLGQPISGDLAVRLDLTGQVHGIDAAERFFNEVNEHSERMYGALLSCYVKADLVDKSLSHFKTMKDKGLITNALAYNNIMTLYMKIGQVEKVPKLLIEMEENSVSPDGVSFKICLKSLALKSDTTSMEKVVSIIESESRLSMDWSTCSLVANHFIDEGCTEKAVYYLQQAEHRVRENPVGIKHLITMYAKLGNLTQVMSLWQKHKAVCKAQINVDYMTMIGSLVKMDEFQEADRILREWESSGNLYDFRVPNVLLLGYSRKGLVEKAERILEEIISNGKMPVPNTWSIISAGHIECRNMDKALRCMKKALELGVGNQSWVPNQEVVSSLLKWLGDEGEIGEVNRFIEALNRVVPMDRVMYHTLLRANIRHGNEVGDILQRMQAASIDVDEETSKLLG